MPGQRPTGKAFFALLIFFYAAPLVAYAAQAPPVPAEETAVQQCGACHMPYPAQMLPARSWQNLMADLSHHFGEDASLSDQDRTAITGYLTTHAADGPWGGPEGERYLLGLNRLVTPLRITDMPFWRYRHREIPPQRFSNSKVKTASNCVACHDGHGGRQWGD
jgi:hypothetical protein